jgi:hypothetical protein
MVAKGIEQLVNRNERVIPVICRAKVKDKDAGLDCSMI